MTSGIFPSEPCTARPCTAPSARLISQTLPKRFQAREVPAPLSARTSQGETVSLPVHPAASRQPSITRPAVTSAGLCLCLCPGRPVRQVQDLQLGRPGQKEKREINAGCAVRCDELCGARRRGVVWFQCCVYDSECPWLGWILARPCGDLTNVIVMGVGLMRTRRDRYISTPAGQVCRLPLLCRVAVWILLW